MRKKEMKVYAVVVVHADDNQIVDDVILVTDIDLLSRLEDFIAEVSADDDSVPMEPRMEIATRLMNAGAKGKSNAESLALALDVVRDMLPMFDYTVVETNVYV